MDMAEATSRDLVIKYKQLDAAVVQAQKSFFAARGRYKTSGPARLSFIRGLHEEVDKTTKAAVELYRKEAPRRFEEAARNAFQGFQMTDDDRKQLNRLQAEGAKIIKGISDYTKRDVQRFVNVDSDAYKISTDQADKYIMKSGIKGARFTAGGNHVSGARQTIGNYSEMAFRSNLARINNLGFLSGAKQGNISVVEVTDGPDCGWSFHRDSDKANGKIVSIEEAEAYPLAHPHCQRRFLVRPGLTDRDKSPKLSNKQKAAIAAAAASSGLAVLGLAANMQTSRIATFVRQAARSQPHWMVYEQRLKQMKHRLDDMGENITPGQLYDFVTGMPIVETEEQLAWYFAQARSQLDKMRRATVQELAEIIHSYGDIATFGDISNMPLFIRQFFNMEANASRKVVGDHFRDFAEYKNMRYAYMNMTVTQSITEFIDLESRARDAFYRWLGPVGPRFARFTVPNVGGQRYGRFSSVDPSGFVKGTRTAGRHGFINRLTFNSNGTLRAGFVRDPRNGRIYPNFRLVPKGPLRIFTEVNRSKTGKVTSVSAIVRLITKGAVNYEARFNISLRALNIYRWQDIPGLRWADIRRLRMDPNLFTFVSTAAHLRIKGPKLGFGKFATSFDFAHIFRVKWEDAKAIYELSSLYLREQLDQLRSWAVRGTGDVDWAMFGIQMVELPDDPQARTIWIKDIINRILRALGLREE